MRAVHLSRASAGVLAMFGAALLFAADDILPRLIAEFPKAGAWLGQLLGGAWLGLAALNWLNRGARLGGVYGGPVGLANRAVYFLCAMVLLRAVSRSGASTPLLIVTGIFAAFAVL